MNPPRKKTAKETLDAIMRSVEADEAIAAVAKKTDEEVLRDLKAAGFDLDAERAKARAQIAELEGAIPVQGPPKVVPIRQPRAMWLLVAAAIAAAAVVFLGSLRNEQGHPPEPVAHPSSPVDASSE
jgi:hypothetical protein